MKRPFVALALPLATAATALPLAAQFADGNHVIGWTNSPLLPSSGQISVQDIDGGCQPARNVCGAALLHNVVPYAGGTGYDPRFGGVWISDSRAIELRELSTCRTLCTTTPHIMDPAAVVSGLAVGDARRMLYQLETKSGYLGILPYFNRDCPPTPTRGGCTMRLRSDEVAAGLAFDEVRDLLYFTTSRPGVSGPEHTLHVVRADDRCNPLQSYRLPDCPGTPLGRHVLGLGYDACTQILYATGGTSTVSIRVVDPVNGVFRVLDCCQKQFGGAFGGLAVVPGWRSHSFGRSCPGTGCPSCGSMEAETTGGDPSLGNSEFGVRLSNAPARAFGFLLLRPGRCWRGVGYPFTCGLVFVNPDALVIGFGPYYLGTGPGCTGGARQDLTIPVDANLCGLALCAQWIVQCTTPSPVLGVSNAIEFTVTGS